MASELELREAEAEADQLAEDNQRLREVNAELLAALRNFVAGYEADEVHEGHLQTALAAITSATT